MNILKKDLSILEVKQSMVNKPGRNKNSAYKNFTYKNFTLKSSIITNIYVIYISNITNK